MRGKYFLLLLCLTPFLSFSQGTIRGDLMVNSSFFQNDSRLGQYGTNTTQYKRELSSAEAWLYLNYNVNGFDFNVRYDMFHNSALLNPQEAYTSQGVPFFNASKSVGKLDITIGSFYDQFGSGILFRAYEDRVIGLDFAMQGLKLKYNITPNAFIKAYTGKQKFRFDSKTQVSKGINFQASKQKGDFFLMYGAAAVNRTLDENEDIKAMAAEINSYDVEDRFIPKYNVYGGQIYTTITYKKISLMLDAAAKSKEALFNYQSKLINKPGYYATANLSFTTKKFGVSVQGKYSEYFTMRTSPFTQLNPIIEGTIGYLPPINRQNTYRLAARYSPAVQELGELGAQIDLNYNPTKNNNFNLNISYIEQPSILNEKLFQEVFFTYQRKWSKKIKTTVGIQSLFYNQKVYQGKPENTPNVNALTPFVEAQWKIKRKLSVRCELQYLKTDEDLGDFAFALLELNIAPNWSFSVSDMVNTDPREETRNVNVEPGELVHYPTMFLAYTHHQTRFTAGYIKQVEGVICTGGVCRVEPAFSGFRFGLSTNF